MPANTSVSSSRCVSPSSSSVRRADASIAPGGVDAAAHRLEHRLAPQRDGLDGGRPGGDAEHPHDVEAAPAGAGHRARAPQRGARRARRAPRSRGAGRRAARAAASARSSAASAAPDPPESGQRQRVHVVRLGLAAHVADGLHGLRHGRDRLDDVRKTLRLGEHRELGDERGVPRASASGRRPRPRPSSSTASARDPDLARREQGFAPFELQVGATRIVAVEPVERPPEQSRSDREVVALERAVAGAGEVLGGTRARGRGRARRRCSSSTR